MSTRWARREGKVIARVIAGAAMGAIYRSGSAETRSGMRYKKTSIERLTLSFKGV